MKAVCVSVPNHSEDERDAWQRVGAAIAYASVMSVFVVAAVFAAHQPGPLRMAEGTTPLSEHERALEKISSYARYKSGIEKVRSNGLTRLAGFRQNIRPTTGLLAHTSPAVNSVVHETATAPVVVWRRRDHGKSRNRRKYFSRAKSYRTVCVRLCDGFYFPVSAHARPRDFVRDEAVCANSCGSPARLFVTNDLEADVSEMQDLYGRRYSGLRTAFRYRRVYDQACTCKAQPWQQEAKDRHKTYALASKAADGDHEAAKALPRLQAELQRTKAAREIAKAATIGGLRPLPHVQLVARTEFETPDRPSVIAPRRNAYHRYAGHSTRRAKGALKSATWTQPMGLGAKKVTPKARLARATRYYRPVLQTFKAPFGDY